MTMIRINLIAEKKAGAPKVAKKASAQPTWLQDNIILIIAGMIAIGLAAYLFNNVKKELKATLAEKAQLQKTYDSLKIWEAKKEEFEIQRQLLIEKIQKISDLKENRAGPVKLMEDVYNVLPESVWLSSVTQGYSNALVKPSRKGGKAAKPRGSNLGNPRLIQIHGFARTTDAITNLARAFINLDERYKGTDLNRYDKVGDTGQYEFYLFFELKKTSGSDDQAEGNGKG